jgi:hypothetical protein
MKYWTLLVAFLYFLILAVVTWPVGFLAFYQSRDFHIDDIYSSWFYWSVLGVMMLAQATLLTVPVSVANRRPVSQRSLLFPLIASGLMAGCVVFGTAYSLYEFITKGLTDSDWGWGMIFCALLVWCLWTVIFYRLSRDKNPRDVISKQCRYLLGGSILELLVAVPTHVVARSRDYCCAGAMTFLGLASGISVMLFSFGPGVFFLFVDRWKKLHPQKKAN